MTDERTQLSAQNIGPTTAPTTRQARRAGLRAAEYALTQPDPAGVLAELVDALDLAAAIGGRRCRTCAGPLGPAARYRTRYCGRSCAAAGQNAARWGPDARQ
jgi:hypothetical protein